jgi:flagellar biosynthesis GTPase FlhF
MIEKIQIQKQQRTGRRIAAPEMSQSESIPTIAVGVSDIILISVSVVGFGFLTASIYRILWLRARGDDEQIENAAAALNYDDDQALIAANVATLNRAQRRARAKAIMKQQRRVAVAVAPAPAEVADPAQLMDDRDDNENAAPDNQLRQRRRQPVVNANATAISRKKRQEAAKAQERWERKVCAEQRHANQEAALQRAQQEKLERLALAAQRQSAQAQQEAHQDQERRDRERATWSTFLTKNHGKNAESEGPAQSTLTVEEFVRACREQRRQCLDDYARRFDCSGSIVRSRIGDLVRDGRLAGWFLCDNVFVVVSDQELQQMATGIRQQTTVLALSDVAQICQSTLQGSTPTIEFKNTNKRK